MIRPNEYWKSCADSYNVNFTQTYDTIVRNIPVEPEIICTDLEVDVSTPFLEVCETSLYSVTYCNHGTLDAENVTLSHLILDDDLTFIDSEPSFTTSIDSLYTFDVGNLASWRMQNCLGKG